MLCALNVNKTLPAKRSAGTLINCYALGRFMRRLIILSFFITPFLNAQEFRADVMERLIQGNFILIGKSIDSENTYSGEMSITKNESGIEITRIISGKEIKGTAAIEYATPDKVPVLRFRFKEDNKKNEATCMVGSDLDNFARMTCHVYFPGIKTSKPGFEALFINYDKPW